MVVGSAVLRHTLLMAKAMNRPFINVLFSNFGGGGAAMQEIGGSMKPIEAADVAARMAYAERVVIVPGYGLAVAQAQHKIWELTQRLQERGVKVKFAIHPVAGRMPGHMNLLLAEDDALLADALTVQLRRAGFTVEHAPNGPVAEYLCTSLSFDCGGGPAARASGALAAMTAVSVLVIVATALIVLFRSSLLRKRVVSRAPTWDPAVIRGRPGQ